MYRKTADEIMALDPEIAIIPVGSLEQHGPHLPVMTDWAIASELGRRVAEKMNAFLVPAMPISTCRENMGKKGTVWMEPLTYYQMMTDIIMSLKLQGFKKIVILQMHGGVFINTPLVRDLNARHNPDLMVALVDGCSFFEMLYRDGIIETSTELHSGEVETSQMLYLAPETVHMDQAVDFVPNVPRNYLNYGSMFRATPTGVWGEPSYGSAEKGERIFAHCAEQAVQQIHQIFAYMEKKEKFNYSYF